MQKIISVKQKHIRSGIRELPDSCPVALALRASGFEYPSVCGDVGDVHFNDVEYAVEFPRSVQRFVNNFDKRGPKAVKPFNFKLNINTENK